MLIFAVSNELRFETKACARLKSGSGILKEGGRDSPGVSRWVGGGIQAAQTITAHVGDAQKLRGGPSHVDVASQTLPCS